MATENLETLAEKIAALIAAEAKSGAGDLVSIQRSLDQINKRLEKLESTSVFSTIGAASLHPSQDRFAIAEAIVDSLFEANTTEKACTFEPNGKPCDHCSMCSSRGF